MSLKLGEIKWYGDRYGRLKYGFISEVGGEDYYFNEESCDWAVDRRDEYALVIFSEAKRSRPERRAAGAVHKVTKETDFTLLQQVTHSLAKPQSNRAWQALRKVRTRAEIRLLFDNALPDMPDRSIAMAALTREDFLGPSAASLRSYLEPRDAFEACLESIIDSYEVGLEDSAILTEALHYLQRLVEKANTDPSETENHRKYNHPTSQRRLTYSMAAKRVAMIIGRTESSLSDDIIPYITDYLCSEDLVELDLTDSVSNERLLSAIHMKDTVFLQSPSPQLLKRIASLNIHSHQLLWVCNLHPSVLQYAAAKEVCEVWSLVRPETRVDAWPLFDVTTKVAILEASHSLMQSDDPFDYNPNAVDFAHPDVLSFTSRLHSDELLELMRQLSRHGRMSWFAQLPTHVQEATWTSLEGSELLLALHKRVVAGDVVLELLSGKVEEYIIKYVELDIRNDKSDAFTEFHHSLLDWAINNALRDNKHLDLAEILPHCTKGLVSYCEGRPWPNYESSYGSTRPAAYCPRMHGPCEVLDVDGNGHAHIEPIEVVDVRNYSLIERLADLGISPAVAGLVATGEYTNRLAGWVNRLNEIRERLKCSACGSIMTGNMKYAKNLARYSMTVASCREGSGHDQNVYLNHCWNCLAIIDSRESRLQERGFYVCVHCGAADPGMVVIKPGEMCPVCGNKDKSKLKVSHRSIHCRQCDHTFLNKRPKRA